MPEGPNLFEQQNANKRRSRLLVIGFVLFFAWLGFGGDWIFSLYTASAEPGEYRHSLPLFGLALSAIAIGLATYAWKTGPQKVLWAAGAREIQAADTAEERQLVNVVEEMAVAAALPRPRIFVVPDADPNAFATGRDEATACVAVTQGLLGLLSRDELQAVIAHEMGHVKNLDVRLMTLLASLVGAVALIQEGMGRMLRGGMRVGGRGGGGGAASGSRSGKKGGGAGPVIVVLLALWLISWILAPLITRVLALGVSRKREYLADAMSAQFTRNPAALASALAKIEGVHAPTASIKSGSAHLCIADPLGRKVSSKEGWLADLLGTHPPMPVRIARLKGMAYQDTKRSAQLASAAS
ncbi:MAG: M48 family metallopeptidase [Gemmatimonadaceae bacterium]